MSKRPDYVTCVQKGDRRGEFAWCGKPALGFVFADIEHALLNHAGQGRLVCCPECAAAILTAAQAMAKGPT